MNETVMDDKVKETIDKQQEYVGKYLEELGANAAATTYTYDVVVSMGAAGAGFINVDFKQVGSSKVFAQFKGVPVGGVGGYTGWGQAWFNKPVEELIGVTAGFTFEMVGILGATCHVQITDAKTFIGNCSTGGVGIGGGAGAGAGSFNKC